MRPLIWFLCSVALLALPSNASPWSQLSAENQKVKKGNALMAAEREAEAVEA